MKVLRGAAWAVVSCALASAAWGGAPKRVLILRSGDFPFYVPAVKGFTEGLAARRVPFSADDRTLPRTEEEVAVFMEKMRADPPDIVLTVGTLASRVLQEKGGGVPFVYCMVVDPPALGLVGGGAVMELRPSTQIAFIRENFPSLKRIGVIHGSQRNREVVRLFREEGRSDPGLVLVAAETPEEMSRAIQRLAKEADCLLMVSDSVLYSPQTATQVILQTLQSGLPIFAVSPSFVKAGALAAIYPDYEDNGVQAAEAAARFFGGEALSGMPVLWPARTRAAVNLVVAKRLGVSIAEKTVRAAAEVVR